MANTYFRFKQFTIHQQHCAMKVTTDACLFGAWVAERLNNAEGKCLDIGTGTGLLSLMLAQKAIAIETDAIEIDQDSANQAKENITASPWANQITVQESDIKHFSFSNQYDFIISNPPFYQDELKSTNVKKNTAHHDDGLQLGELFPLIKKRLKPGGCFFLLLPFKRMETARGLIRSNQLTIHQSVSIKQTTRHEYFRTMLEGGHENEKAACEVNSEMAIKDEADQYTSRFAVLLKDYYLHL